MNEKDRALELYHRFYCKSVEKALLFEDNFVEDALNYIDELIDLLDVFCEANEIEYYLKVKEELKKL